MPRQLLRLGLSQSASSLFLADGVENLSVLAILAIGEGFFQGVPLVFEGLFTYQTRD